MSSSPGRCEYPNHVCVNPMLALDALRVHTAESGDLLSASDIYLIAKQGLGRHLLRLGLQEPEHGPTRTTTVLVPDGEEPVRVEVLDSDGLTGDDVLARFCLQLDAGDEEASAEVHEGPTSLAYRLRRVEVLPRGAAAYLRSVERSAKSLASQLH